MKIIDTKMIPRQKIEAVNLLGIRFPMVKVLIGQGKRIKNHDFTY
jgi:hypothetical protein